MTDLDEQTHVATKGGRTTSVALIAAVVVLILLGVWLGWTLLRPESGTPAAALTPSARPSASPSGDPARQEAEAKILDSYNKLYEALIAAGATSDWHNADISKYAGVGLAVKLLGDLRMKQSQGLIQTGRPQWSASIVGVDLAKKTAEIKTCFDGTNWVLINKSTGKPAGIPGQAKRFIIHATAQLYDNGVWRIETSQPDRSQPC
jgi:hypothetical protein